MRIVAGLYGGRRLLSPDNRDIRPTSDKIRGAIFNSLRSRGAVEGAYVLDGFCGTGALGFEALSQGASHCVFADSSRVSLDLARENAAALGIKNEAQFIVIDMGKYGQKSETKNKFNLVFLDPPYNKNLITPALESLDQGGCLAPDAILVVESERKFSGTFPGTYALLDEKISGETKIGFLSYAKTPE
jgi:16S rRNA (guanine966-N2)-methyltransferase